MAEMDSSKPCCKCGLTKDLALFAPHKYAKFGRSRTCITCVSATAKAVKKPGSKVRAKARAKAAVKRQDPDFREKQRLYCAEWRVKNREIIRAQDWLRRLDNPKQMQRERENRAKYGAASAMRRHAARLNASPEWADPKEIRAVYAGARRMTEAFGRKFEVDHIVPIRSKVVCGLHVAANLQVLDKTYNALKSNKWWPEMWPAAKE